MRIHRSITSLAIVSVVCSAAAGQAPMAENVPDTTLVYVGWAGRSLTFDGSLFGQLLQEPGIKEICAAVRQAGINALGNDAQGAAAFKELWQMGAIAWQHPAAVALFDVVPSAPGGGNRPGGKPPRPQGALIINLQKDRAAFGARLQALMEVVGKDLAVTQQTIGDVTYQSFPTPVGPCGVGFVGDIFFAALGTGSVEKVVALAGGKAKRLSADARFQAAMKQVARENVQLAYYVDVARLYEVTEKIMPPQPPRTAPAAGAEGASELRRSVKALGLDGVTALVGATSIVDRRMYERTRLLSPAPHRGILSVLAGKPLAADALAGVPADAMVVAAVNLDPARLLAEIKSAVAKIDPDAGKQLDAQLEMISKELEVDVERELLVHMGDQWTLCSAPSLGGFVTGTVLSVQLKDPAKFSAALAKVEAYFRKMLRGEGGPAGPDIRTFKAGDVQVRYLALSGFRGPEALAAVAPAWAVHKGRLYVAAYPQVVAAAVAGVSEKPLTGEAEFQALRKRVSPSASALLYIDTPKVLRQVYGLPLLGWTVASNLLGRELGPVFRPDMMPTLPKLEKYLRPSIAAVSSDAEGITIESYGSFPGMGLRLNGVPFQGLSAAVLVPSLMRARTLAKRSMSLANLRGIHMGVALYQNEHEGKFPPDLLALIDIGIQPRMLMSPTSGNKVLRDAKGKAIGPFDYVYLGAGMSPKAAGSLILAYERPEINRNRGACVLYVDGSARWVDMERFRRDLAKTQEYLRRRSDAAGRSG